MYETESHFHCIDHVLLSSAVLGTLFSCCECSSEDLTFFGVCWGLCDAA